MSISKLAIRVTSDTSELFLKETYIFLALEQMHNKHHVSHTPLDSKPHSVTLNSTSFWIGLSQSVALSLEWAIAYVH